MSTKLISDEHTFFAGLQQFKSPKTRIVDIGAAIPESRVSNEDIADLVDAPAKLKSKLAGLIHRTTGNRYRSYAPEGTMPSDLACEAIDDLVRRTGIRLSSIDTLIFASTDLDMLEPATANIVQEKIGLRHVNAFDVSNACNSFLQAMNIGNSLITTGAARRVLICSGELGSAVSNRELSDVTELRVKMGGLTIADAGAAMLLEASTDHLGLYEINLLSLGEHWRLCHVPADEDWRRERIAQIPRPWFYLDMPGLAKIARRYTLQYFRQYADIRGKHLSEKRVTDSLDYFIPHQISRRMLEQIFNHEMKLDSEKVVITADLYGNTASTSIPLALRWLMDDGRLRPGEGKDCFLYGAASGFGLGHVRVRI